jgi:hypothetical protein
MEMKKSMVFGHPDLIKKVPLMSKTQIDQESNVQKNHLIPRIETYQEKMRMTDRRGSNFEDAYEMIELAPEIFKNIRKIQTVDDGMVKSIFSLFNINKLDIRISTGKGGSFFIEPIDGG